MKEMKLNEKAVSPVIATILMVAITVVLSGVLYVWASQLAEGNTDGDFSMYDFEVRDAGTSLSSESGEALAYVSMGAGEDLSWSTVVLQLSADGNAYTECTNPDKSVGAGCAVSDNGDGSWSFGEEVTINEGTDSVCDGGSICSIQVKVLDRATNKLIYESTETSLAGIGGNTGGSTDGGSTGGSTSSTPACSASAITISEMHGGGAPEDWIEIHNSGAECDLEGFQIYDKGVKEDCDAVGGVGTSKCDERIVFVSGDTISANGYMWFCEGVCSDADSQVFGFGIKGSGDTVHLRAPDGSETDYDTLGDEAGSTEFDCSSGVQVSGPHGSTPGAANNCYTTTLVVNEVANKGSAGTCLNSDGSGDTEDWIEIWNYGANAIDMTGMQIVDDKDLAEGDVYTFSTTLGAGQYLLMCKDDSTSGDAQFEFGIGGDDSVLLYDANSNLIHSTGALPEAACEADAACNPDDVYVMDNTGAWGYTTGPTPGAEN
jgi:flagellin-like protein